MSEMMWNNIFLQCVLLLVLVPCHKCLYTKWLPNTDLNNPYNWDTGRPPCGNDRMILPDDGPVVFLQMNTTIQELVLPRDGQLVFGAFSTLAFTNEPDHSATCLDSGTDTNFNASHPQAWLDPQNWCPTDTEQGACKTVPLLDTERVPCVTDDVIFPTGSSYYVDLGAVSSLEVNTLKVSGKAYSTSSFQLFLATDNGRGIFPLPQSGRQPIVTINRRRCTDVTGCGCGNDQGQILEKVCQIQSSRCQRPRCKYPIKPVGHCCQVCGGMLNITYGTGFNLNTLKTGLQRNVIEANDDYKNVQYIVSKRSDGKVQIVLLDGDGVQSSKTASYMQNILNSDIANGGIQYAVTRVSSQVSSGPGSSTNPSGPSAHTGSGKSTSKGTVAGITVGLILLAMIGSFGGYVIYQRKTNPEDSLGLDKFKDKFSRFNKFTMGGLRKPQVSVPPSVGFSWGSQDSGLSSVSGISGAVSQGFDNPIYGDTPFDTGQTMELEMTPTEFGAMSDKQPYDDRGFDNPLYDSVHQESLFDDQSKEAAADQPTVMTIGGPGQRSHDTDA